MTENKRFTLTNPKTAFQEMKCGVNDKTFNITLTFNEVVDILNKFQELSINDLKQIEQLKKENGRLKSENNMLKNTIRRNESYIEKITHKGEWSN